MIFSNVVTKGPSDKSPYRESSPYTTVIREWILPLIPFSDMELMGHKNRSLIGGLNPHGRWKTYSMATSPLIASIMYHISQYICPLNNDF